MSLSETRSFLEDLVLRYNSDTDISEGSRAQAELIEPILQRVGIDPFDEDISVFVRERIRQAFPTLAITEADDLTDTLIDPMRVLLEPLVREVKLVKLRASLRNQASLSDDEIDALMGNFFESRRAGGYSTGVVRIYFANPQTISIGGTQAATTRAGLRFFATRPQQITADQMRLNVEGAEYYFDVNFTSENRGDEYNVEAGEVVSIASLPTSTRVSNLRRFRGGVVRETSYDFIARAERSQSDKTLTVERGISATLFENFPALRRLFVVGFRDPEMVRDVIEGGSLGPVPENDLSGAFYGLATAIDDLDGDGTTPVFEALTGSFITRLGSVNSTPTNWYATLVYTAGSGLIVIDSQVQQVLSGTLIRVDHEIPLAGVSGFTWMLRERRLTITGIPGGIALPNSSNSTVALELRTDQVHIGGKTDVYVAGEAERGTAAIGLLTDEAPIARGFAAVTDASNRVQLNDGVISGIVAGMSLVLEEGQDAGSYLILQVNAPGAPLSLVELRLATIMTGSQSNLSYRVVDEIDVELTDPKALKIDGSDLITSAGNAVVQTASSSNFVDASVQVGDVLSIAATLGGGEFSVTEVGTAYLKVSPAPSRTLTAASYRVFTRSPAVSAPIVRITSLELLDSANAPTGTLIPYREPVLAMSHSFQNEGSGYLYDGLVIAGLVSKGVPAGTAGFVGVGAGVILELYVYHPEAPWKGAFAGVVLVFAPGIGGNDLTAAEVAAQITADPNCASLSIRATVITYASMEYVGIIAANLLRVAVACPLLGMPFARTNAEVTPLSAAVGEFASAKIHLLQLAEFVSGNNAGELARVVQDPNVLTSLEVLPLGTGPAGPRGAPSCMYNAKVLRPDVGARVRIGRASVGSARVFFQAPTSAEFDYASTRFTAIVDSAVLSYAPDPENMRVVLPAYPRTDLVGTGTTDPAVQTLSDTTQNFLLQRIQPGDVIEILYTSIVSTAPLTTPAALVVGGTDLVLRLGIDPFITISFPVDAVRQNVADYINTRVGTEIATIASTGHLVLMSSTRIEIDMVASTPVALSELCLAALVAPVTTDHPGRGEYIISGTDEQTLRLSVMTPMPTTPSIADTHYRIRRYVQRISSTEMNLNVDPSGLYYADIELVSLAPGNAYNIGSDVAFGVTGHRADGYRLTVDNEITSFSRAEILRAQISPSMLLVGSSDSPAEYVQLPRQSVQVAYERSQVVDDIQSFCDSDFQRVVCEEILVRHLTPHYVSLNWSYVGGNSEPDMLRAVTDLLDAIEPGDEFEVGDVVDLLRKRGAVSVYTPDTHAITGRSAPMFVVVYHGTDRRVRGIIVHDYVDTVRTQRFLAGNIALSRVSVGGIR